MHCLNNLKNLAASMVCCGLLAVAVISSLYTLTRPVILPAYAGAAVSGIEDLSVLPAGQDVSIARDPFEMLVEPARGAQAVQGTGQGQVKLKAIILGAGRGAVIEGQAGEVFSIAEGSAVGGFTVTRITENAVLLERGSERQELRLEEEG